MNAKKICILWHCPYPWDIRIDKMFRTFLRSGFEVSIICRDGSMRPIDADLSGKVTIYKVTPPRWYPKKAATTPLFFNPIWVASVIKYLRRIKPDVLIIRDIPLALLGGLVGTSMGISTILDMAENYPAALIAYNNKLYNPFLFKNAIIPRFYEKRSLRLMKHIWVVCDEQKRRLAGVGVDNTRITVINNTPDMNFFAECRKRTSPPAPHRDDVKKLVYIGKIDAHRGIDVLIKAVSSAYKKNPALSLTLVGSGTELERLKKLAMELGASNYITFIGWIKFDDVPSYIQSSHIGVIPHLKCEHTDTTIPNKLFDYMAFAKPIISSNLKPVEDIINEVNCGRTFESGDHEDLASKILEVCDLIGSSNFGEKGYQAVAEKYNWHVDEQRLIASIRGL